MEDGLLRDLAVRRTGKRAITRFLRRAREYHLPCARRDDVAGWAVTGHHAATAAWAPGSVTWLADFGDEAPLGAIRADPIHLSAGSAGVTVGLAEGLGITQAEAERLCLAVADSLGDRVISCRSGAPDRWYLTIAAAPDGPWWAPEELGDRDLLSSLPAVGEGTDLRVLLNEIQVVLHQQEVNAMRREKGLPEVNSVWLWGWSDRPLPRVGAQTSNVYSSDPYATGLARLAGLTSRGIDETPGSLPGDGVVVMTREDDGDRVVADWCEPLVRAFGRGRIARLRFVTRTGRLFEAVRRTWRMPWRRRRRSA
jgi:hypothetical protein